MPQNPPHIHEVIEFDVLAGQDIRPTGLIPSLWGLQQGSERLVVNLTGLGVVAPDTFDPNVRPPDLNQNGADLWFFQLPAANPIPDPPYVLPGGFVWGIQMDINVQTSTEQATGLTKIITMAALPVQLQIGGVDANPFGEALGANFANASGGAILPADANNQATAGGSAVYVTPIVRPTNQAVFGLPVISVVVVMSTDTLGSRPNIKFENVRLGYKLVVLKS